MKEQKEDLMGDLYSSISPKERNVATLSEMNRILERFEQLVLAHSKMDENNNLNEYKDVQRGYMKYLTSNEEPMSNNYIIPIYDHKKKLYLLDDVGNPDDNDAEDDDQMDDAEQELISNQHPNASVSMMFKDMNIFLDKYDKICQSDSVDNRYRALEKLIHEFYSPFEMDDSLSNKIWKTHNSPFLYQNKNNNELQSEVIHVANEKDSGSVTEKSMVTDTLHCKDNLTTPSSFVLLPIKNISIEIM